VSLRVLVIDDERLIGLTIREFLEARGYTVERAETATEGLQLFERTQPDVVLLDLQLPDAMGLDLIPTITQHPTHPTYVIIITAYPDAETAVQALKRGAWDYLVKPINFDELLARLNRLSRFMQLEEKIVTNEITTELRDLATNHPQLRAAYRLAQEAARSDHPVCVVGEIGTGRLRLAQAIHRASSRRQETFLSWTATSDPEQQRSQLARLIGAEPGALGAGSDRKRGLLEVVGEGTLVIREVQWMGAQEQKVLEGLLINRSYRPMGGGVLSFAGRLIMTATPSLEDPNATPDFDPELRRQVLGHTIFLPPLRDRQQDLYDLIQHLIKELNAQYGTNVRSIEPAAVAALMGYPWPGNVGELRLVLERLWVKVPGSRILRRHLPSEFVRAAGRTSLPDNVPSLADVEKQHILKVLDLTRGNQTQAAKILDIARSTLINKLKQYQLNPEYLENAQPMNNE